MINSLIRAFGTWSGLCSGIVTNLAFLVWNTIDNAPSAQLVFWISTTLFLIIWFAARMDVAFMDNTKGPTDPKDGDT